MVAAPAVGVPPLVVGWSRSTRVLEIVGCEGEGVDFSKAEQKIPVLGSGCWLSTRRPWSGSGTFPR